MLQMIEGFDHYVVAHSGNDEQVSWKGWAGQPFSGSNGRFPYGSQSQSMNVIVSNAVRKALPSPVTDLVLGFAFRISQLNTGVLLAVKDQDVAHEAHLGITSAGHLTISDGTTTTTGTAVIAAQTWYYVELKLSSGNAEVHLNETVEIGPVAGDYTQQWYVVEFQANWGFGSDSIIDDFYLCDLTGPINNDFLGDVVVETLFPIADGTYRDWTPDTGSDHFSRVNEHRVDSLTSYVKTSSAGDKDSYSIGDPILQSDTPILGIQLNLGMEKADSGSRVVQGLVRQSSVDYLGPTRYVPGDWGFISWLLDLDPTGSDWTAPTVIADEYGVAVAT